MSKDGTPLFTSDPFIPEGLHRPPKILVVDDDQGVRQLLRFHLKRSGCEVATAEDGEKAVGLVADGPGVDLVLLDLVLPGMSGLETLKALRETGNVGSVVLMSALGTMDEAITALKEGAYDFVNKSGSFDDVRMAVRNALETVGLREELENLRMRLDEKEGGFTDIIGASKTFQQVMKLVRKVTDSDITVLIEGESGTGKELIARAIHFQGQFRQRPFVALNCAAIPENLLESELFGHEKGAFTGAVARRIGKFEEAHEGTLFLDEIGELSQPLQAKLLRVLQTREIEPIGGSLRKVQVRIISATNHELQQQVRAGRFREDLYYRLAVFPIKTPPLRERMEDIPLLTRFFVNKFSQQEKKEISGVEPDVMNRLRNYPWYGNVRELENVIYRAVVLNESGRLTLEDFPNIPMVDATVGLAGAEGGEGTPAPGGAFAPPAFPAAPPIHGEALAVPAPPATLEELEIAAIRAALAINGGNMSKAAVQLKIGRATLYRKSKKYGIGRL